MGKNGAERPVGKATKKIYRKDKVESVNRTKRFCYLYYKTFASEAQDGMNKML